jgi:hypothetical protein
MPRVQPSSPSAPAVLHQAAIEEVLHLLINSPSFPSLCVNGPALNKLIRSYHYWAEEERLCPYDFPKLGHFRMSVAAEAESDSSKLIREHLLPVAHIQKLLVAAHAKYGPPAKRQVPIALVQGLMAANELVILHENDGAVTPRDRMPNSWKFGDPHDQRLPKGIQLRGRRLIGLNHQQIYQDAANNWPL